MEKHAAERMRHRADGSWFYAYEKVWRSNWGQPGLYAKGRYHVRLRYAFDDGQDVKPGDRIRFSSWSDGGIRQYWDRATFVEVTPGGRVTVRLDGYTGEFYCSGRAFVISARLSTRRELVGQ